MVVTVDDGEVKCATIYYFAAVANPILKKI